MTDVPVPVKDRRGKLKQMPRPPTVQDMGLALPVSELEREKTYIMVGIVNTCYIIANHHKHN